MEIKDSKKITEFKEIVKYKKCDSCGIEVANPEYQKKPDMFNGYDEFVSFNVSGGYNSKLIGDGVFIKIDLCEECFAKNVLNNLKSASFETTFSVTQENIDNGNISLVNIKKDIKNYFNKKEN